MAESVTRLRVLVASPGDTEEERARLDRVAAELNRGVGEESGFFLDLIKWETHSRPGIGEDAQDVINRQLPDPDIVIGIFWRRLGTPTRRAASGTAEELQRALDAWRRSRAIEVLVYFSAAPYTPLRADLEQLSDLAIFRDYLEDSGFFCHEYDDADEFEAKVREHLGATIRNWKRSHDGGVSPQPALRLAQSRRGATEGWHEQLCSGSLAVELNARRRGDVHTLASVVQEALREQKFHDAAPRAAAALTEVLMNVARHTEPGAALVEIDVDSRFLRRISLSVHDQGTGFDLEGTLEDHYRGIERGEREHGLLLVSPRSLRSRAEAVRSRPCELRDSLARRHVKARALFACRRVVLPAVLRPAAGGGPHQGRSGPSRCPVARLAG
jgi:anti-sigma regulatory factor (Ser/Thr protein kinase)